MRLNAQPVKQGDMGIIEDIAYQTVVNAEAILKILRFKGGIGYLFAEFGLYILDYAFYLVEIELVADD